MLSAGAAAGGLALINSMGQMAGFLSPYLVGFVKDATGSTDVALYLLAAVIVGGSLLALRHRTLPMTLNYETPDPGCPLNVVREPVRLSNDVALAVNRSHIGQSAAAAFRAL